MHINGKPDDDHFAALRKLDSTTLMQRGRTERGRAMRILVRRTKRTLGAIANRVVVALERRLLRSELARYDDRLLRDMGLSRYDIASHRRAGTIATWLDRSRQRKRLAGFAERDLHDIGISKCDADAEIEKPFWRA